MRILVVTRSIPLHPSSGGMERAAWDLTVALADSADVSVLTTSVPGYPRSFTSDGVAVNTIRGTVPGRYSLLWWIKTALRKKDRTDVIFSVSAGATSMIWFRRGPAYIFQAHGTANRDYESLLLKRPRLWILKALRLAWWTRVDKRTYKLCYSVVSIGPAVSAALRHRPYKSSFVHTDLREITNGIDIDRFRSSPAQRVSSRARFEVAEDEILTVVVTRLSEQKGVDLVINAIALGTSRLLVVGSGEELERLERQSKSLNLDSRIDFVGQLDRAGVTAALHAADVFAFTPRNIDSEGLPLSVMEALAASVPVIAEDSRVWPENIRNELSLVDVLSAGAVAALIAEGTELHKSNLPIEYSMKFAVLQYIKLFEEAHNSRRLIIRDRQSMNSIRGI